MTSTRYDQVGANSTSILLKDSQYIVIPANKAFLADLIVWTKPSQKLLVCTISECKKCIASEIATFEKMNSVIEITLDKPNDNDNSKIDYNIVQKIAI